MARDRAAWLVRMRIGAEGLILVPFVLGALSHAIPDVGKLWVLTAVVAVVNVVLYSQRRRPWTWTSEALLAQTLLDLVAITLALHWTGGVENPFQAYYLFPVIVSGVVLPTRQSYAVSALAALAFVAVAGLEYTGTIAHHDVAML